MMSVQSTELAAVAARTHKKYVRKVFGDRCGPLGFSPEQWIAPPNGNPDRKLPEDMLCTNFKDIRPALKFFGNLRLDWMSMEFPCRQDFRDWRRQVLVRIHPDKGTTERVPNDVFYAFKVNSSMFIRFLEDQDNRRKDGSTIEGTTEDVFEHNARCWKRKRAEVNDRYDALVARFGDEDFRLTIKRAKEELNNSVRTNDSGMV